MNKQFSQLVSVLLLIAIAVGAFVFVGPMRSNVTDLKTQVDEAGMELETLNYEKDRLGAMAAQIGDSESSKDELLEAIPVGENQDAIITELNSLAEEKGISMNSLNFTVSSDDDFGNVLNISANFSATYENLLGFLQKIENADRLFKVNSLNVQLSTTTDAVFNLNLEAYYQ